MTVALAKKAFNHQGGCLKDAFPQTVLDFADANGCNTIQVIGRPVGSDTDYFLFWREPREASARGELKAVECAAVAFDGEACRFVWNEAFDDALTNLPEELQPIIDRFPA